MRALILTDGQVAELLAIPKFVPIEPTTQEIQIHHGETVKLIGLETESELPTGDELSYAAHPSPSEELATVSLWLRVGEQRSFQICRYDRQLQSHTNPKWFHPRKIERFEYHRHVYNEKAVREESCWDRCAEPIGEPENKSSNPLVIVGYLKNRFIQDLNIDFISTAGPQSLFGQNQ